MAYVLSITLQSPLKRSFSDTPYLRAGSPFTDDTSIGYCPARKASVSSHISLPSFRPASSTRPTEYTSSPRSKHLPAPKLAPIASSEDSSPRSSHHEPRTPILGPTLFPSTADSKLYEDGGGDIFQEHVGLSSSPYRGSVLIAGDEGITEIVNNFKCPLGSEPDDTLHFEESSVSGEDSHPFDDSLEETSQVYDSPPAPTQFRRWMTTLRRRRTDGRAKAEANSSCSDDLQSPSTPRRGPWSSIPYATHKKSHSLSSSMGFVTTVKSASITVASTSNAPASAIRSIRSHLGNGTIKAPGVRASLESSNSPRIPLIDERGWERARKRGEILAELLQTEESYIGDMKILVNVYFTLLASVPSYLSKTRRLFHNNVAQIIELHEDLLRELHGVIPGSDSGCDVANPALHTSRRSRHARCCSLESSPDLRHLKTVKRRHRHSIDFAVGTAKAPKHVVDTLTAGKIAKVFNQLMKRFFTYEEYVAHFEEMRRDIENTRSSVPLSAYERGIEALSAALLSLNNRDAGSRKCLTVQDLFIKPVQRMTKLSLILEDLCRHTPVYDDPESHAELEKALFRLKEANRAIDKATDNPKARKLIEISWILQDRLVFEEQRFSKPVIFNLLGHVLLCGVLHVAYDGADRIQGHYMICILYRSCVMLAVPDKLTSQYNVVVAFPLAGGSLVKADDGRGLQCYTAPFTWKLVFQADHKLYEIILSACSSEEETKWRTSLLERIDAENHAFADGRVPVLDLLPNTNLKIKSLGSVFGQSHGRSRRQSVNRTQTLGPWMDGHQVIIKNTQARRDVEEHGNGTSTLSRSLSLLSTNHIPTLAPRRQERIRLETALSDVWTKDELPYPAMAMRRSDTSIRASANAVIRKMSMASLTSNFTRRSTSASTSSYSRRRVVDESWRAHRKTSPANLMTEPFRMAKRTANPPVNFDTAPEKFLPDDFNLPILPASRVKRGSFAASARSSLQVSRIKSRPSSIIYTRNRARSEFSILANESHPSLNNVSLGPSLPEIAHMTTHSAVDSSCEDLPRLAHGSNSSSDALPPMTKRVTKRKSRLFKFLKAVS